MLAPGPSNQGPHLLSKMPGQMIMAQQGGPIMGQVAGGISQGGMPGRMPQVNPFTAGQTPHPGALGTGPPGTPVGFYPQGTGAQGPDPRLLQERQMVQQRIQMVQKLQQQFMVGQQSVTHQGQQSGVMNQQAGSIGGQAPQALMSNAIMGQQQPNIQPGLISSQQHQQGLIQVPQGMMGNQAVGQAQSNIMTPPMTPNQSIITGQQGIAGNQPLHQIQRPQGLMAQQVSSEPQHVLRGPQGQLTAQQQSVLAQRMLISQQQQNNAKNLAQLQQQQIPQQRQLTQMGASEKQGAIGTPSSGIPGNVDNLRQGVPGLSQDVRSPAPKDGGILSPKTPPQQAGSSTPIQIQQGPSGDLQGPVGQQPATVAYMVQQQATQQQPGQNAGSAQQHSYINNQQTGLQPQEHMQLALQRQNSLNAGQVKQEGQQICYVAQQLQQGGQNVAQIQGMLVQQSGQSQAVITGNPNQQQDVLAQQQLNRSQQIMTQRSGAPSGQIRAPINIQALIAQNPQLRHLPHNQQLQLQAIIAQRQAQQQSQILRLQGQTQGQIRPQGPQPVGLRMPGLEAQQQHPYAFVAKQGSVGASQQQGVIGQPSVMTSQFQNAGSLHPQQTSQGVSPQYNSTTQQQQQMMQQHQLMRGQLPLAQPMIGQARPTPLGHMARPMSPRQLVGQGSPGSPHSGQQRQMMGMRQTPPGQAQCLGVRALSPFQASPSHLGSPAGSAVQDAGSSPASFNKHDFSTISVSNHPSPASRSDCSAGKNSPLSNVGVMAASPLRSPIAKAMQDVSGLKSEPQGPGTQKPTTVIPLNGPSPKSASNLPQPSVPAAVVESEVSNERDLCKFTLQNIKQEPREINCDSGESGEASSATIKREISGDSVNTSNISGPGNPPGDSMGQIPRTETGQQLLQKLLRTKSLQLPSQRTSDGIHNEINGHINSKLAMLEQKLQETPRNMEVKTCKLI